MIMKIHNLLAAAVVFGSVAAVAGGPVVIRVNPDSSAGTIRALHGGNCGPTIHDGRYLEGMNRDFRRAQLPFVRLHDDMHIQPGMRLCDIAAIFPVPAADPADPRNYHFAATDDYIANIRACGVKNILYRLGPSIEHCARAYFRNPPQDVEHWIEVCSNIIRHYNEGWNNGHHWNIEYWEIWNEPDIRNNANWTGTVEDYFRFYVRTAKELKRRFPNLKFGGPAAARWKPMGPEFIRYCAENQAPLDFFSWHIYTDSPSGGIATQPGEVRKTLDEHGYKNTLLFFDEWNLSTSMPADKRRTAAGAAFIAATLSRWQDTPVDMGFYYTTSNSSYGWYIDYLNPVRKGQTYYVFPAFAELLNHPRRMQASSSVTDGEATALAGKNDAGEGALLASCFRSGARGFQVEFPVPVQVTEARLIDRRRYLDKVKVTCSGNTAKIPFEGDSAVLLLKFKTGGPEKK